MPLRALYRAMVRRRALDRDMQEEMAAHLEQAAQRFVRRGFSPEAAREMARREFGNVAVLQEESRDIRGGRWLDVLVNDVRFAARHYARTPVTAATLVLVLSLGIGVNAALFSLLQGLTKRPAPGVPADDALVRIRGSHFSRLEGRVFPRALSMPEVQDLAARRDVFASVSAYALDQMVLDLGDGSDPRVLRGHFVTPNFFSTLGLRPALGPGLPLGGVGDTPGAELAVVIAYSLWLNDFEGDSAVIGRAVRVNDVPVRIVGVAPPRFHGAVRSPGRPSLWIPVEARAALTRSTPHALATRDSALFEAIARLTLRASVEQAGAVVRVVAATTGRTYGTADSANVSSDIVALRGDTDIQVRSEGIVIASVLSVGALLVLLVACTNVSALLVGAGVARRREIAIRLSLGASRVRLVRQLLTESVLVAIGGGTLGLAIYWVITRMLRSLATDIELAPDLGTILFTAGVALGTGIIFGLSPALHATRLDVATALKSSGSGATSRSRLQRGLIVAQIVLSQPLLVAIGVIIAMVIHEGDTRVDDSAARQLIFVQFSTFRGVGSDESKHERIREVMERVAALPGVTGVVSEALTFDAVDLRTHARDRAVGPRAGETIRSDIAGAAPGYFALQGISLVRGRDFTLADTAAGEMAVVVNTEFARAFWGSDDPIGKRVDVSSRFMRAGQTAVVIGVFDLATASARWRNRVFTAYGSRWRDETFIVRVAGDGAALIPAIRRLARQAIPDIPLGEAATLQQKARDEQREILQVSAGASAAGLLALLLASIGLYGVVSLAVQQRQREIGVRGALGARGSQVVGLFFRSGVRLGVIGTAVGLPLSMAALYLVTSRFGQTPALAVPPVVIGGGIVLIVIGVASLASWIPARRASTVDPLIAMRAE